MYPPHSLCCSRRPVYSPTFLQSKTFPIYPVVPPASHLPAALELDQKKLLGPVMRREDASKPIAIACPRPSGRGALCFDLCIDPSQLPSRCTGPDRNVPARLRFRHTSSFVKSHAETIAPRMSQRQRVSAACFTIRTSDALQPQLIECATAESRSCNWVPSYMKAKVLKRLVLRENTWPSNFKRDLCVLSYI